MDGRDLMNEILPNYQSSCHIYEIANKIPKFIVSSIYMIIYIFILVKSRLFKSI